jgi:hypothetical protein
MRKLRFSLKTLMIVVAFAALLLTVIMQSVLLRRAAIVEEFHRAEAERQRNIAAMEASRARAAREALERIKRFAPEQEHPP